MSSSPESSQTTESSQLTWPELLTQLEKTFNDKRNALYSKFKTHEDVQNQLVKLSLKNIRSPTAELSANITDISIELLDARQDLIEAQAEVIAALQNTHNNHIKCANANNAALTDELAAARKVLKENNLEVPSSSSETPAPPKF